MDRHRAACPVCVESEGQARLALNMLRTSAMEPELNPSFDFRLIRRCRVQALRARVGYWSPAAIGATIAGIAVVAALQMITQSSRLPSIRGGGPALEARRADQSIPDFPSLEAFRSTPRAQ